MFLKYRERRGLFRLEDVVEGQRFLWLLYSPVHLCRLQVDSQAVQLHHFRKAFFDAPPPFHVSAFLAPADLEGMLKGAVVIRTQEHVDGLLPTAQTFLSLHHYRPSQVRAIPFLGVHFLPPFFSNVLRKR